MRGYFKDNKDHEKGSRGMHRFHPILFCVRTYVKSTQYNPYCLMQGVAFLYNTEVIYDSSDLDYDFGERRPGRRGQENEAEEVKERTGQCVELEYSHISRCELIVERQTKTAPLRLEAVCRSVFYNA